MLSQQQARDHALLEAVENGHTDGVKFLLTDTQGSGCSIEGCQEAFLKLISQYYHHRDQQLAIFNHFLNFALSSPDLKICNRIWNELIAYENRTEYNHYMINCFLDDARFNIDIQTCCVRFMYIQDPSETVFIKQFGARAISKILLHHQHVIYHDEERPWISQFFSSQHEANAVLTAIIKQKRKNPAMPVRTILHSVLPKGSLRLCPDGWLNWITDDIAIDLTNRITTANEETLSKYVCLRAIFSASGLWELPEIANLITTMCHFPYMPGVLPVLTATPNPAKVSIPIQDETSTLIPHDAASPTTCYSRLEVGALVGCGVFTMTLGIGATFDTRFASAFGIAAKTLSFTASGLSFFTAGYHARRMGLLPAIPCESDAPVSSGSYNPSSPNPSPQII